MPPPGTATATHETAAPAPASTVPESAAPATNTEGGVTSVAGNSAFARALETGGFFIDPDLTQDTTCVSPSNISAANRISHSAMVQYSAPVVQLTPGFGVESGSEFLVIN